MGHDTVGTLFSRARTLVAGYVAHTLKAITLYVSALNHQRWIRQLMNALRSLRIGTRLAAAFIVLLLLLFTVAASSLSRLSKLASSTENIVEIQVQRAFLAQESSQHAQLAANTLLKLLQTSERQRRSPL